MEITYSPRNEKKKKTLLFNHFVIAKWRKKKSKNKKKNANLRIKKFCLDFHHTVYTSKASLAKKGLAVSAHDSNDKKIATMKCISLYEFFCGISAVLNNLDCY